MIIQDVIIINQFRLEYEILAKVYVRDLVCRSCVYLFFGLMMWD